MNTYFKQVFTKVAYLFLSIIIILFVSCKKDINGTNTTDTTINTDHAPDLSTKITSSISGFVTDQNDSAVAGASVNAGSASTITDRYGHFEIKNAEVVKEAATVTVTYRGYFKGIKTYIAAEGKAAFFRIKLLPKNIAGTINAGAGGAVSLTNGLNISFPANAVKDASTGAAYTGMVNVAAQYIDPSSDELNKIMPGDLRGISTGGFIKGLTSYGMMAVELTGDAGQLLQIADGKKATITMPVPASIASLAPASIPLWYFDETNGLWKEEGSASKIGNTYVGDVAHFSFWNCDAPSNYVHFDCTIVNAEGTPIPFVEVRISPIGWMPASGYTDSSGYVAGLIPANMQLTLQVFGIASCAGYPVYSQNFTSAGTDISLGNISVTNNTLNAILTGTLVDCNNLPVSSGSIIIEYNNAYAWYNISGGTFTLNTLLCTANSTATVSLLGRDNIALQQGLPSTYVLVEGINTIGNVQACGTSILDYYSNGYFYHPTAPRAIVNRLKTLEHVTSTSIKCELGDVGAINYYMIMDVDPVTNHITITAAPGAFGGPYLQWDDGLPTTDPGYTPQWTGSAECNNTYDPITHTYKIRCGYVGSTGYRVDEELITGQ